MSHRKQKVRGAMPRIAQRIDAFSELRRPFSIGAFVEKVSQACPKVPLEIKKSIIGAVRSRDFLALKRLKDVNGSPQLHSDPDSYFQTAQLLACVTKFPFDGQETVAEANAIRAFLDGEERCRVYNARIKSRSISTFTLEVLERAGCYIDQLLGDFGSVLPDILGLVKHGPGATLCLRGIESSFYDKTARFPWSSTSGAAKYLGALLREDDHLSEIFGFAEMGSEVLTFKDFDVITTVNKTVWTKRTISKQPRLAVYLQLGLGAWLTERLRKWGVDLHSQGKNQEAAFWASLTGEYATVDMSNASGHICRELIRFLIMRGSPNWYDFFYDLRTPSYKIQDGEPKSYEMWSGMGNGYTFPLETMVFHAICLAVRSKIPSLLSTKIHTYGDDLIIHKGMYDDLVRVFNEIGFVLNEEKSFHNGPFRESCGADYWYGINVRPTYLKQVPVCAEDIYYLHNSFLLISDRIDVTDICSWLVDHLNNGAKLYGPYCDGRRSHLWAPSPYLHAIGALQWNKRIQSYCYKSRVETPRITKRDDLAKLLPECLEMDLVLYYQFLASGKQNDLPAMNLTVCSGRVRRWSVPIDPPGEIKVYRRGKTRRRLRRTVFRFTPVPWVIHYPVQYLVT